MKQTRAPFRHFKIVDCICICHKGYELDAAKEVVERIRRFALFHRPRKAYVFMDAERGVYVFGIDSGVSQHFIEKHPEWLVGFYTQKATAQEIADDFAAM